MHNDRKIENSGPVANDSLAAESFRSGGSFSKGNPTGISDVKASHGTFSGHSQHDNVGDVYRGKKPESMNDDSEQSRSHHLHNKDADRNEGKHSKRSGELESHEKAVVTAGPYSKPSAGSHGPEYIDETPTVGNTDIGSERDSGRLAESQAAAKSTTAPQSAQVGSNKLAGENPYAALSE